MEAFTDSLAAQLSAQGVQVNIVEPGNYDSQIGKNATQRTGITSRFTDRSKYQDGYVGVQLAPMIRRTGRQQAAGRVTGLL